MPSHTFKHTHTHIHTPDTQLTVMVGLWFRFDPSHTLMSAITRNKSNQICDELTNHAFVCLQGTFDLLIRGQGRRERHLVTGFAFNLHSPAIDVAYALVGRPLTRTYTKTKRIGQTTICNGN